MLIDKNELLDIIRGNEELTRWQKEEVIKCVNTCVMYKQPTLNKWISIEDKLPIEYLCSDGEYDPSDTVLCQLRNGTMKFSRYWNHRHCKETIINQPWLDLEEWDKTVAWRNKPTSYKKGE